MFGADLAASTPTLTRSIVPTIPHRVINQTAPFDHSREYAPEWDRDTDTFAGFISWKSAPYHNEHINRSLEALLGPICQFFCDEMKHQLANQSTTIRIPGLQDIRTRKEEMQKQIICLTETIDKLTTQVASLTQHPTQTATSTAPRVVPATPQQHLKPPATTKPTLAPAPAYVQVVEKQPREFTEVRSKKKARKETVLPKPYPMTDRLIIFSLTTAPNDRKEAADHALQVANKIITTHTDIDHPPLILANITAINNFIFTVAPQHLSTTYKTYLGILEDALHEFHIASSRVSQRLTRFIIHGVPTTATPESDCTEIETSYPPSE